MTKEFHERFNIEVHQEEARRRFMNRAYNKIFTPLSAKEREHECARIKAAVVDALGEFHLSTTWFTKYVGMDFRKMLIALEVWYRQQHENQKERADKLLNSLVEGAETDIGIKWSEGKFLPTGAGLLDDALVNENLRWLRAGGHQSVIAPFEKGLRHYLDAEFRAELLHDVVTDMYEALEAMARVVTGRQNHDLSANAELFVAKLDVSGEYRELLKTYISYANRFRHAVAEGTSKPKITRSEAESFMYLTGVFVRLAKYVAE